MDSQASALACETLSTGELGLGGFLLSDGPQYPACS
jgi:hypothetical protein